MADADIPFRLAWPCHPFRTSWGQLTECTRSPQMLSRVCLAVSNARVALPNFYNIAIRIANVAARLAVLGLRLRDELGSSTSPKFVARLNICNADVHKAADQIGIGGWPERYRWFVGCRTA